MSELVDLVDKTGEVQLRGIPRDEAANYPDLHMQIVIVVAFDSLLRMLTHRRGTNKKVDPEKYDHICGAIQSGETPEQAGAREGLEETGVTLSNMRKVSVGINQYGHWRHLFVADAEGQPSISRPNEVAWVGYVHPDELHGRHAAGEGFVTGFFEDVELALALHSRKSYTGDI